MSDQDTPTAESKASMCSADKVNQPWGRLYAGVRGLNSIDLYRNNYVFGRTLDCDVIMTKEAIRENRLGSISKKHFQITKEPGLPAMLVDYSKNGTFINEKLVGKNQKHILEDGAKIAVSFVHFTVYTYKAVEFSEETYLPPKLRQKYMISRLLGEGACGEVRLVFEKTSCKPYAVKRIKKCKSTSGKKHLNHPSRIENEIRILKSLSHECIVEIMEMEETDEYYFIILEYLEGGELTDRILSIEPLPESVIKFLFYQMALAVQYLHYQGITHRDLKPQNVLLVSHAIKSRVKITDFGLSKFVNDQTCLKTLCGTPYYLAPEVWDVNCNVYDSKVDVWSLGTLLFYMFAKELPFKDTDLHQLAKLILIGEFSFGGKVWGRVSKEAKDLIRKMLTVDPKERISMAGVLAHNWIAADVTLQCEIGRLLKYMPESSQSADFSGFTTLEPPRKKRSLSE